MGQNVSVAYSKNYPRASGAYRVVSIMPNPGGTPKYRIKSDVEKFDRIVDELHLAAA